MERGNSVEPSLPILPIKMLGTSITDCRDLLTSLILDEHQVIPIRAMRSGKTTSLILHRLIMRKIRTGNTIVVAYVTKFCGTEKYYTQL